MMPNTIRRGATIALIWFATGATADIIGPAVSATFDLDGRLWRVRPYDDHIAVDYSTDLAQQFSPPVRISAGDMQIFAEPENRPAIAVHDGRVAVLFFALPVDRPRAYISYSSDGKKFSAAVPATPALDRNSNHHEVMHVDDSGRLHLFWIHEPADGTPAPGSGLYTVAAEAMAAPFAPTRTLSESVCECCRLSAATANDGYPVVMTRFVFGGKIRDMGLARLRPDAEPVIQRVTDDDWLINGCPEHGPALSIAGDGRYHFTWFTQGAVRKGIFYAHSDDQGRSSSRPVQLGDTGSLPGHPHVAAVGEIVVITWRQFDGKASSVFAMSSQDSGETWSTPVMLGRSMAASDYPFVIAHESAFYVSWYAGDLGYRLYPISIAGSI